MNKRVCIIVLDGVGIGELPDANEFGDCGSHTLGHVYHMSKKMNIPNLIQMGLGNIAGSTLPCVANPIASYGKLAEKTKAKDTTSGHFEIAGFIMEKPFKSYINGFPSELISSFEKEINSSILGNIAISGTKILEMYGDRHMHTKEPIVYTSADSVFQIAAHEEIIPLDKLYEMCEIAYNLCKPYHVGRIIARPFLGKNGEFKRTSNRKDYAVPPESNTILDYIKTTGKTVYGIGKIEDIFAHRGLTRVNHTTNNHDGIEATIQALHEDFSGLIFTNLVDFDMLYGHRNDIEGFAEALSYFDNKLPEILGALKEDDLFIITADHGCDPSTTSTDHSREYIPLLLFSKNTEAKDLGIGKTFADIAATTINHLELGKWCCGEVL